MLSAKCAMFDIRNPQNTATDCVDKMHSYFCSIRYQATYTTPVAATVIYKRLIEQPYGLQA